MRKPHDNHSRTTTDLLTYSSAHFVLKHNFHRLNGCSHQKNWFIHDFLFILAQEISSSTSEIKLLEPQSTVMYLLHNAITIFSCLTLNLSPSSCLQHYGQHSTATPFCPLPLVPPPPNPCQVSSGRLWLSLSNSFLVGLVSVVHLQVTSS